MRASTVPGGRRGRYLASAILLGMGLGGSFDGIVLLVLSNGERHAPHGLRRFFGGLLLGWGLFNVVEGVVDHHLLDLHHVRPGPNELVYDLSFLAWGTVMLVLGLVLTRGDRGTKVAR